MEIITSTKASISTDLSTKGEYIPINKGHFEMDTNERATKFYEMLSEGWEDDYQEYRKLWISLAKEKKVRDYPLLVDLEMSSKCNLSCPMCYTITEEFLAKVDRKYMDFDLYKKIIDEIAGKVYAVRLSLRGEPTLNKHFIDAVKYAKDKGIQEVSTLTHGKKLTGNYLQKVIDAGIDWITVSIDGMGETYNNIRKPLTWEATLGRLNEIKTLKEKIGTNKPVIKVQGIWPAIRENPSAYYESLIPYADLIAYNPLIDYLRKDSEIIYEENFSCPQLYQRLVVGSDGNVMKCSNDEDGDEIVGNAYNETIYQIWNGAKLQSCRDSHKKIDGFKESKVCSQCYYPRKAIPNETAMVGDRKILIENYVNRPQKVGF